MKHNLKKRTWLCAAIMMGTSVLMSPAVSADTKEAIVAEAPDAKEQSVEPRSSLREWVFKVIDGHLYKRLYNYSTGRWESDWILIE